jgi:hypothetical protein
VPRNWAHGHVKSESIKKFEHPSHGSDRGGFLRVKSQPSYVKTIMVIDPREHVMTDWCLHEFIAWRIRKGQGTGFMKHKVMKWIWVIQYRGARGARSADSQFHES